MHREQSLTKTLSCAAVRLCYICATSWFWEHNTLRNYWYFNVQEPTVYEFV